jgi:6-phosphogluconolactonase (cycloisomerase 2 family)
MKFSKLSQLFLVSILGLLVATLFSACEIETIDYVFVANSAGTSAGSTGQIQTFDADSQTGALRQGAATVPSGGVNPIAMAISADYANLYVVNAGSRNVTHFALAGNGVLTQKEAITTSAPTVSVAVNTAGTYPDCLCAVQRRHRLGGRPGHAHPAHQSHRRHRTHRRQRPGQRRRGLCIEL